MELLSAWGRATSVGNPPSRRNVFVHACADDSRDRLYFRNYLVGLNFSKRLVPSTSVQGRVEGKAAERVSAGLVFPKSLGRGLRSCAHNYV